MHHLKTACVGLGLAAGLACTDVDSGDVGTEALYADLSVETWGDGTSQAIAVLRVGGANSFTFVELNDGDTLEARLDTVAVPMERETLADFHRYVANFSGAPEEVTYTIAFLRDEGTDAPSSTLELPPAFTLDALGVTSSSRADDDLTLQWGPTSTDPVEVSASGECIVSFAESLASDTGSYTFVAGTLEANGDESSSCDVTITVTRERQGRVDPGFEEGGRALGRQLRSIELTSDP